MLQGTDVPRGYNVQKTVCTGIPFSCKGGENVGNFHHTLSFDDRLAILAKKNGCKQENINQNRNPLHPNISIHILHTDLSTFPVLLTRRICLTIFSFLNW